MSTNDLVLASASQARYAMLAQTGLVFTVSPAAVDENDIIAELQIKNIPAAAIAEKLAAAKAQAVAATAPGALIIGADQILVCEGALYQKAADRTEARTQLRALRGKSHELISAVCVVRGGMVLWRHTDQAQLTMKNFDDAFLERYLTVMGERVLRTVGGYELEGLGAWLFDQVSGDYFTILGMPLLPLLHYLETQGFGP